MKLDYDSLCLFQGDLHFFVDQNRDIVTKDTVFLCLKLLLQSLYLRPQRRTTFPRD